VRKLSDRRIYLALLCAAGLTLEPAVHFPYHPAIAAVEPAPSPQVEELPNLEALKLQAQKVTVKVYSGETWGSGVIIGKKESTYMILTNEHVLQRGSAFRIQTEDGKVYDAVPGQSNSFGTLDLALLQMTSEMEYSVVPLGRSQTLQVGDQVFASGFPIEAKNSDGYKFTQGRISLISAKSLDGGYELGYTNAIEKGMSGGAVLNDRGELIAVNGIHAYPLWGDPYVYTDGTAPCEPLRKLMTESSLGIPEATFAALIPGLTTENQGAIASLPPPTSAFGISTIVTAWQTFRLQQRAEQSAQCHQP
jgi:Trypsin-like peptidase domain